MTVPTPPASSERPKRSLSRYFPGFALLLALGLFSCAGFFSGAGETMVSDEKEAQLGAQFNEALRNDPEAKKEFPIFVPKNQADIELQNYVINTCNKVLASIPPDQLPAYKFTFTLIDKDEENAFAVPGGYVYIFTGILKKMKDESELAGVIGHEITHVTEHHYREAMAKNTMLGVGLDVLLGVAGVPGGQATQMAAGTFYQLVGLKFSRSAEAEADVGGTVILGRAGLNPMGIAKYFARAEEQGVPEWLSDHPGADNRVKAISEFVKTNPELSKLAADSAVTNRRAEFQKNIGPYESGSG